MKNSNRLTESPQDASAYPVKRKDPLTSAVNGSSQWAMADSNGCHPRCKRGALESEPVDTQELTATPSAACTAACTSEGENVHNGTPDNETEGIDQGETGRGSSTADRGNPAAKLSAALLTLSPEDRMPSRPVHIDADLRTVIDRWGNLPEAVRAGIVAMVRAAGGGAEG